MAYSTHDTAVMKRINRIILEAIRNHPKSTMAEKLEMAWSANIAEREKDSTNTIGRNDDYYFAARKEFATSNSEVVKTGYTAIGEVAWPVYALGKLGSEALGHPEWTRTDNDKPTAPVGGFVWMNRGIADGYSDVGDHVGNVSLHTH